MNQRSFVLLAMVLAARAATAQPGAPNPAADAALADGRRLYDLQEWDNAIAKFKEAYRLREDPPALFNIAQAYRLKGDCAAAASFYKTFKRKFPREKTIDKVDKFITEMDACAKPAGTRPEPVKPEPVKPEPVKPEPVKPEPVKPEPVKSEPTKPAVTTPGPSGGSGSIGGVASSPGDGDPGKTKRLVGLGVAGAGVALVATGIVFAFKARRAASDAEGLPLGSIWMPNIEDRGETAARRAWVFGGIGGAALIGGTVLYVLGRTGGDERATVSVVPTHDGVAAAWSGAF